MYWIYFIIFTLIVFIPSFVSEGLWGFSVIQTQEYVILFMGTLAFSLFTILEGRLKKNEREKNEMIGQINRTNKNLTQSYSYIGEMNRKLDIMMDIVVGFPDSSELDIKKQKKIYDSIMEAIRLFGKSDEFEIRFIHILSGEILKEVKSEKDMVINFPKKNYDQVKHIFEDGEFISISSPKTIDDVYSCIILKKKSTQQNNIDYETMQMLAMQALSFFIIMRKKKNIEKNKE